MGHDRRPLLITLNDDRRGSTYLALLQSDAVSQHLKLFIKLSLLQLRKFKLVGIAHD